MIASKYANPEVGRRNLETLAAATLEATLLEAERPPPPDGLPRGRWSSSRPHAFRAYRALVYETPGFDRYFRDSTVLEEIATSTSAAGRPRAQAARHRGPARDPLGVQLGAVPPDAAGLVRLRHGGGAVDRRPIRTTASPRLQRDARRLGLLPHHALQHGHGAGQERHRASPRATPSWSATRRCASRSSSACAPNGRPRSTPCARSCASSELLEGNPLLARSIRNRFPYIDPLNHVQIELLRRHRAGDDDPDVVRGHPPHHQRHRRGAAQQRIKSSLFVMVFRTASVPLAHDHERAGRSRSGRA